MTNSLGSVGLDSGAELGVAVFGGVVFAVADGLTGMGFTDFFFCGCSGAPDGLACIGFLLADGFFAVDLGGLVDFCGLFPVGDFPVFAAAGRFWWLWD